MNGTAKARNASCVMGKLQMAYEGCHQATIFHLLLDGINLRLMRILDRKWTDAIGVRVNWLCGQPAIKHGTGVIQIEVTPEVIQVLNELQFMLDSND